MEIKIPFGHSFLKAEIPLGILLEKLELPKREGGTLTADTLVSAALENLPLKKIAQAQSLAIVVSDHTRPIPNGLILEQLWWRLKNLGMEARQITIFVATGLHDPPGKKEIEEILGPFCAENFKVVSHNARQSPLKILGKTQRGTIVKINRGFMEAKVKLAIGLVQPHQIMGFSGGAKNVAVGLAGEETIVANHSLLDHPSCYPGNYKNNPARQEIEEIGKMAGLDYLINVVCDAAQKISFINAGKVEESYAEAVAFAQKFYQVPVHGKKDLVITSPGGYPQDLNLYQAQKALNPAVKILKPHGVVILVARCQEGLGNQEFFKYLARFSTPDKLMKSFLKEPFAIGPHKAYLWAKLVKKHRTILVSNLEKNITDKLMVECVSTLSEALARVPQVLQAGCQLGVISKGTSIIPQLK